MLMWAIIFSLLAALLWVVAYYGNLPPAANAMAILAGLIFIVAAGVIAWDYLVGMVNVRTRETREAAAITPQTMYLKTVSELDDRQMDFLRARTVQLRMLTSPNAPPVRTIVCENLEVPADFAEEFLTETGDYFPAVRDWPEGSRGRRYAQDLTSLLVIQGWADLAAGNRPAKRIAEIDEIKQGLGL